MHDVGGEQKQLKKGNVGFPGIAGNLGQRIIVEEFAVVLFDGGSRIVEQIHPPGRHFEIGHKGMINVFGILNNLSCLASCGSSEIGRRTTIKRCRLWEC